MDVVKNEKCWASVLGDCSGKISGEHIWPANVFSGKTVTVSGPEWCAGEARTVGLANITSNMLCEKHNSELGADLDAGTKDIFKALNTIESHRHWRLRQAQRKLITKVYPVRGYVLERSLLKVTINCTMAYQPKRVWSFSGEAGLPPEAFVRFVFGKQKPQSPLGLYIAPEIGASWDLGDSNLFSYRELLDPESDRDELIAALVVFHGYRFLWWLSERPAPDSIPGIRSDGLTGKATGLMRHPQRVLFSDTAQVLRIKWA